MNRMMRKKGVRCYGRVYSKGARLSTTTIDSIMANGMPMLHPFFFSRHVHLVASWVLSRLSQMRGGSSEHVPLGLHFGGRWSTGVCITRATMADSLASGKTTLHIKARQKHPVSSAIPLFDHWQSRQRWGSRLEWPAHDWHNPIHLKTC